MSPETIATTWRLVIICGTVLLCWGVAWSSYWDYRKKQLQFEERRIAIENGMEPPPLPVPALAGWPGVKQQELQLQYQERRLMIEKGLPVPAALAKPMTRHDYLRRGIIAVSLGVAAAAAYGLLALEPVDGGAEARAWAIGLTPFLLLFGIANLIYQRFAPEAAESTQK